MIADRFRTMMSDLDPTVYESYIYMAVRLGSSDVHFEPLEGELRVRLRVDGALHELARIPHQGQAAKKAHPLIVQIKAASGMQLQSRVPEDGRLEAVVQGHPLSLRVASMPQVFGEKIVLRLFDVSKIQTMEGLGFRENQLDRVLNAISRKSGIVLVAGPTGSGKTTTLYAILNHLNKESRNLVSIEDPVEHHLTNVNQIQVSASGVSFETAMRALLRHDPDIIMVGEIRDRVTAEMAFHAALTGHLVLTTVHAQDTVGALMRLVDLQVPQVIMAHAINGVVAQRLMGRLCDCAIPGVHPPLERVNTYEPNGCDRCMGTGYLGQQGVQEVLVPTDRLRKVLSFRFSDEEFRMLALKEGMETLKEDAIYKSIAGQIHYRDALGVTDEPLNRILGDINRMLDSLAR
ncbi:type II/IV secretion system protein [bacterium CPR1]|nr:type II/IV secretion system protein [bacterium CPR1]